MKAATEVRFQAYSLCGCELRAAVNAAHARGFQNHRSPCPSVSSAKRSSAVIRHVEHGLPFATSSTRTSSHCSRNQYSVFETNLPAWRFSDAQIRETIWTLFATAFAGTSPLAANECTIGREFSARSAHAGRAGRLAEAADPSGATMRRKCDHPTDAPSGPRFWQRMAFERAFRERRRPADGLRRIRPARAACGRVFGRST